MKTTRMIINDLAKEYLADEEYIHGFIQQKWIDKVTEALNLKELSDLELSNMWDMVYLAIDNRFHYYDSNKEYDMAIKYRDVQSAFTEVVNEEARRRRRKA